MKKLFLFLCMALTVSVTAMAKKDKQINETQLPGDAQLFLHSYFSEEKVDNVICEAKSNDYEVTMASGTAVDFDRSGSWKEVDCNSERVPSSLVPSSILNKVAERYGIDAQIIWIKRTKKGYEIELNNGVEISFNKRYKILSKKL